MEVTVTGANPITFPHLATWEWHVALYLFIGGLVAGLMIFSGIFRLTKNTAFEKAIWIGDLLGFPLLALGLFLLWLDLTRGWNAWRFFATFQVTSAMSWGSWILLICMGLLSIRLLSHIPVPRDIPRKKWFRRAAHALWDWLAWVGHWSKRWPKSWDVLTIIFGIGLGIYTGLLLNTMPAIPLWNTSILPFLFLASGLASGCAVLCLFINADQAYRLLPVSVSLAAVELALIFSYVLGLVTGTGAVSQASTLLFSGVYALGLWGLVVMLGLVVPILIELTEIFKRPVPSAVARLAPMLTLVGGVSLRFVIVYAGMYSHI